MQIIPLKILVVDPDKSSATLLVDLLKAMKESVISVHYVAVTLKAAEILENEDINTIIIDPFALGLEKTSKFIFEVRKRYPSIVFSLYVDFNAISRTPDFYDGERRRFKHYYKLDKGIRSSAFRGELSSIINSCQEYLSSELTQEKIAQLESELSSLRENAEEEQSSSVNVSLNTLEKIEEQIKNLTSLIQPKQEKISAKEKSVFLSYRFADKEYVNGLRELLEKEGFSVATGEHNNTYISQGILTKIMDSEFFVCLMTKEAEKKDGSFTTSPWLLEEKGAALALKKMIVLMIEEGVTDFGGLQGDWQRIHFTPQSFTSAVLRAIDQLKSYGA